MFRSRLLASTSFWARAEFFQSAQAVPEPPSSMRAEGYSVFFTKIILLQSIIDPPDKSGVS